MEGFAIIPQAPGSEGFVELSRSASGRVFEKHILSYGTLLYPGVKGGKVKVDDAFVNALFRNFNNKVCDIVQVPVAGKSNEHTEDPLRNIGEVIGLTKRNGKIYARIDARDKDAADRLGKTLLGASAMLSMNYTDTRTGQKVGPTLLHVAVTNRPYIVDLEGYEEVLAATAVDGMSDAVVLTATTTEDKMDLDQMLAELKADHGIDVPALQQRAALVDSAVSLTNAVRDTLVEQDMLTLSNTDDEVSADTLVAAIKGAGEKIVALTAEIEETKSEAAKKDAEAHVDEMIRAGRILPANKDAQVTLLLTNPDLFDALLPEKPLIALSQEQGGEPTDPTPAEEVDAEIARLTNSDAAKPYVKPSA